MQYAWGMVALADNAVTCVCRYDKAVPVCLHTCARALARVCACVRAHSLRRRLAKSTDVCSNTSANRNTACATKPQNRKAEVKSVPQSTTSYRRA